MEFEQTTHKQVSAKPQECSLATISQGKTASRLTAQQNLCSSDTETSIDNNFQ